ncbi:MAG: VOC family protein [Roseiflexaceae bacterium]|nr:VOC family protein [Roseiflexaceae bacterium]
MAIQPDMIGIVVSDMAAALRFYRLVGLEIPAHLDSESHAEITTANGYRIAWDTEALARSINPDWVTPVGQRVALALKCDSPGEVDATYARMVAQGYHGHKPPWDAFWGQRYAVIADPDGSLLDLFAPQ